MSPTPLDSPSVLGVVKDRGMIRLLFPKVLKKPVDGIGARECVWGGSRRAKVEMESILESFVFSRQS